MKIALGVIAARLDMPGSFGSGKMSLLSCQLLVIVSNSPTPFPASGWLKTLSGNAVKNAIVRDGELPAFTCPSQASASPTD
jgi:hypothetical protein